MNITTFYRKIEQKSTEFIITSTFSIFNKQTEEYSDLPQMLPLTAAFSKITFPYYINMV